MSEAKRPSHHLQGPIIRTRLKGDTGLYLSQPSIFTYTYEGEDQFSLGPTEFHSLMMWVKRRLDEGERPWADE